MRARRILVGTAISLLLLSMCLLLISVGTNLFAHSRSQVVDRLDETEKARLLEALHLRQSLGVRLHA